MNLNELKTLFDAQFPSGSLTNAEKVVFFNIACRDIVRKTYCLKSSGTTSTVAAQREYSLPSDCMMIDPAAGIEWKDSDGDWERLTRKSLIWLKGNNSDWRNSDSSDDLLYYYQRGQIIGLEPKPTTAISGGLKIYYIDKPNTLSDDSDTPFSKDDSLEDYHPLIVSYTLWKAKQKRGKFTQAREFKTEYYEGLAIMRTEIQKKPDYKPHWEVSEDYFTWN